MLVRSKQQSERSARWRRQGRDGHGAERAAASLPAHGDAAPRERRHGGPSEDRALYTCECGYAFEALVTTSVGCPHCARTQAW
jgi:hypothetical protein